MSKLRRQNKIESSKKREVMREVMPRIVQLGSGIPSLRTDVDYTWARPIGISTGSSSSTSAENTVQGSSVVGMKCNKYKNLFEYSKQHNNTFDFKTNLWKIPSIGNNFLPFKSKGVHVNQNSEEVIGLYRPKFHRWYSRLVHENTVILPPIETSKRVKENVHESTNFNEKKYIDRERRLTGPRERFTRDELYLPNVYNQCFSCRECRKQYAGEVFSETWAFRNTHKNPLHTENYTSPRSLEQRQHCDVLGERYCKTCIENRNKTFSLLIEDKLLNNNSLTKVHVRKELY